MDVDPSGGEAAKRSVAISELPVDELIEYGGQLGLALDRRMGHGELLRRVRERQELLVELDREALLDVVVWARRPVRQSSSKEQLAKEIASIRKMDLSGLSDRGLNALARLRGVDFDPRWPREAVEKAVRSQEPFWQRVARKRRQMVGSLISKLIDGDGGGNEAGEYKFLPEDRNAPSLRDQIAEEGVVGGIARRLRGAADDYVREKLDEIERRIDRKLDEIDRRLGEWRDREIANRLRIIKITLAASVIVALLSLGYDLIKS
jgi:tetrahydromethanopterin S-methyltransferase subunit G